MNLSHLLVLLSQFFRMFRARACAFNRVLRPVDQNIPMTASSAQPHNPSTTALSARPGSHTKEFRMNTSSSRPVGVAICDTNYTCVTTSPAGGERDFSGSIRPGQSVRSTIEHEILPRIGCSAEF